jgi:dTDP-4-dehydrorhamnose reductase
VKNFLITGSSGRLATEIIKQSKEEFKFTSIDIQNVDITDKIKLFSFLEKLYKKEDIDLVIHCAAWTAVDKAEQNKKDCWSANVIGTQNVVEACRKYAIPILHISTDYVFSGEKGNYSEEDIPSPQNYYALTKLISEYIVRQYSHRHIIVRTSFKPEKWQYMGAYEDIFSSADYIPVIVKELSFLLENYERLYKSNRYFREQENIFHIATERKTMLELARRLNPNVIAISSKDMNFKIPKDCSLNIDKWKEFKRKINDTKNI